MIILSPWLLQETKRIEQVIEEGAERTLICRHLDSVIRYQQHGLLSERLEHVELGKLFVVVARGLISQHGQHVLEARRKHASEKSGQLNHN